MKSLMREWAIPLAMSVALLGCGSKSPDELIGAARAKLANKETTYAIVELKNVLQQRPDSPEARFLLGRALLESGKPVDAMVEFGKAQALRYPDAELVPAMARALLAQGEFRKLVDDYAGKTLAQPAAKAELSVSLAQAHASLSDTTSASAAVDTALKAVPDYVPALLTRARIAAMASRFDEADAVIDQAMKLAPKDPEVWLFRGDSLLIGHGDAKGAMDAYRKALDFDPAHAAARANLVALLIRSGDLKAAAAQMAELRKGRADPLQVLFLDAQLAFANGDTKKAGESIAQVLKVSPDSAKALLLSGTISAANGSLEAAERSFSKAMSISPASGDARRQLARIQMRKGESDRALATIAPLVGTNSTDAQALVIAAEANMLSGAYTEAKARFAQVLRLTPQDVKSRAKMAIAELNLGSTDAAMAELSSIAASDTGTFADLALVNAALSARDLPRALAAIDAIEKKTPGKAGTADLRGRVQLLQRNEPEARKSFERALSLDPARVSAAVSLAQLDLKDKHPEAARKRFDAVLAVDQKNLGALLGIAALLTGQGAPANEVIEVLNKAVKLNPEEPSPRLLLVKHYMAEKDYKTALDTARAAESVLPENTEVLDSLGRALAASGDRLQAVATFQRLGALEPRSIRAPMLTAAVNLTASDYGAAAQNFRKALDLSPDSLLAQQGLLETELAAQHTSEALAFAKSLQQRRADAEVGYLFEARVYVFQKQFARAADVYRSMLKRFPTGENATKLHATLVAAGRTDEAEKFLSGWLDEHPKDGVFLAYAGDTALARKDFALAEQRFRRFSELVPANVPALNNIAWLMLQQGKPGAVAFAERADKLQPNNPQLMDTLAAALAAEQQLDKALAVQKRAVELAPTNPSLRLLLAKLYIQAGTPALARSELESIAKLGAGFNRQPEVTQLLKSL